MASSKKGPGLDLRGQDKNRSGATFDGETTSSSDQQAALSELMAKSSGKNVLRISFARSNASSVELEKLAYGQLEKFSSNDKANSKWKKASELIKDSTAGESIEFVNVSIKSISALKIPSKETVNFRSFRDGELKLDLLKLNNDGYINLDAIEVEEGRYRDLKIDFHKDVAVGVKNGSEVIQHKVKISNSKPNLIIKKAFMVTDTEFANFVLEIDLGRSLKKSNNGSLELKPQVFVKIADTHSPNQKPCSTYAALAGPNVDSLNKYTTATAAIQASKPGWIIILGDLATGERIELKDKNGLKIYNQCGAKIAGFFLLKAYDIEANNLIIEHTSTDESALKVVAAKVSSQNLKFINLEINSSGNLMCIDLVKGIKTVQVLGGSLSGCGQAIKVGTDSELKLTDTRIQDTVNNGIEVYTNSTLELYLSRVKGSGGAGIVQKSRASTLKILNSQIIQNGKSIPSWGIEFNSSTSKDMVEIKYSRISNNTGSSVENISSPDVNTFEIFEEGDVENYSTLGVEPYFSNGETEGELTKDDGSSIAVNPGSLPSGLKLSDISLDSINPEESLPESVKDEYDVYSNGYKFEPSGAKFDKPILAKLPVNRDSLPILSDNEKFALAYYDSETGKMEVVPSAIVDGVIHSAISHFSEYYVIVFSETPTTFITGQEQIRKLTPPRSFKYSFRGYPFYEPKFENPKRYYRPDGIVLDGNANIVDILTVKHSCSVFDVPVPDSAAEFGSSAAVELGSSVVALGSHVSADAYGLLSKLYDGDSLEARGATLYDWFTKVGVWTSARNYIRSTLGAFFGDSNANLFDDIITLVSEFYGNAPLRVDIRKDCAAYTQCMTYRSGNYYKCAVGDLTNPNNLARRIATSCAEQIFLGQALNEEIENITSGLIFPFKEPATDFLKAAVATAKLWFIDFSYPLTGIPSAYYPQSFGNCLQNAGIGLAATTASIEAANPPSSNDNTGTIWRDKQEEFNVGFPKVMATPFCEFASYGIDGSYYFTDDNGNTVLNANQISQNINIIGAYDHDKNANTPPKKYLYPNQDHYQLVSARRGSAEGTIIPNALRKVSRATINLTWIPQVKNEQVILKLKNPTTGSSNVCTVKLNDKPLTKGNYSRSVRIETPPPGPNGRTRESRTFCVIFPVELENTGILNANAIRGATKGSENSCSKPEKLEKFKFGNNLWNKACFTGKARSQELDILDGDDDAGYTDCSLKVEYLTEVPRDEVRIIWREE